MPTFWRFSDKTFSLASPNFKNTHKPKRCVCTQWFLLGLSFQCHKRPRLCLYIYKVIYIYNFDLRTNMARYIIIVSLRFGHSRKPIWHSWPTRLDFSWYFAVGDFFRTEYETNVITCAHVNEKRFWKRKYIIIVITTNDEFCHCVTTNAYIHNYDNGNKTLFNILELIIQPRVLMLSSYCDSNSFSRLSVSKRCLLASVCTRRTAD